MTVRASDARITKSRRHDVFLLIDVPEVKEDRTSHDTLESREIESPELLPLGHQDKRMSATRGRVWAVEIADLGQDAPGLFHAGRIMRAHDRAEVPERGHDGDRGGLTHVIRVR